MFLTRSEYDRGVNTFSPEGRLFQVEYAIEAIKLGSTAVGIHTKEGVILAVEKRITSPLLEPSSVEKLLEIDEHIGCAMSGLTADARTLVLNRLRLSLLRPEMEWICRLNMQEWKPNNIDFRTMRQCLLSLVHRRFAI